MANSRMKPPSWTREHPVYSLNVTTYVTEVAPSTMKVWRARHLTLATCKRAVARTVTLQGAYASGSGSAWSKAKTTTRDWDTFTFDDLVCLTVVARLQRMGVKLRYADNNPGGISGGLWSPEKIPCRWVAVFADRGAVVVDLDSARDHVLRELRAVGAPWPRAEWDSFERGHVVLIPRRAVRRTA